MVVYKWMWGEGVKVVVDKYGFFLGMIKMF